MKENPIIAKDAVTSFNKRVLVHHVTQSQELYAYDQS